MGICVGRNAIRWLPCAVLLTVCGCIVPQPRGEGKLDRVVEPASGRPYYLYLPKDYVQADEAGRAARRWPLVVTFHGMKPYDIALYQALEWQQEADRFGYIVIAPELLSFDFFLGQFPQRSITNFFRSDELATLSILDHVFETTRADPSNVMSTGFSCGGYMAHYMLNRHPERFTCLGVRQANFSASILDPASTTRSIYRPVLILSTQFDVDICKQESREAIRWYEAHGYKNLAWVHINRLGHERTPDIAADFFARVSGAQPNRPPEVLVSRQAIDGNARGLALLAGNLGQMHEPPGNEPLARALRAAPVRPATPRRPVLVAKTEPAPATVVTTSRVPTAPAPSAPTAAADTLPPTPRREPPASKSAVPSASVGISVSSAVGFEPLLLVYSAECPSDWQRTADFSWSLNGITIGNGVNGQRTITQPGDYNLELLVITSQGTEHRAARQIRVLKNVAAAKP